MAAAIQGSKENLQAVQDAGGFERITQLLQWSALTFPKAPAADPLAASPEQQQQGSLASQPTSPRVPRSPFPASPRALAEDSQPGPSPRGLGESAAPSTPARHFSGRLSGRSLSSLLTQFDLQAVSSSTFMWLL